MSIQLICRRCAKETPAQACVNGLCIICVTSDAVGPFKAEYGRLWKKRSRYLAKGVDCKPVEKQLTSVARRLGDQVHRRIANPSTAIAILNAHLEEARTQAERGTTRILVPKPGSMLAAALQ
ncbi:MAG TPA: hypothetical protein VGU71_22355 [Candidatus Dormibacteraeota bacterium]|nr:hypothetical protein [Candidatus Dormibacteraeota bacterium]